MNARTPIAILLPLFALACATAAAQDTGKARSDYGQHGSRIVGPGKTDPNAKGASNPGGLGHGPQDMPEPPKTGAGLPGKMGQKPASESAGKADTGGLAGSPRKGTGGAKIDQVREPDAKAR